MCWRGFTGQSKLGLLGYGFAFSAILVLLRMAWMYPAARRGVVVRTRIVATRYTKGRKPTRFCAGMDRYAGRRRAGGGELAALSR